MKSLARLVYGILTLTFVKVYLLFQLCTRLVISLYGLLHHQIVIEDLPAIFAAGIVNDVISLCYAMPVILACGLVFYLIFSRYKRLYSALVFIAYFLMISILSFIAISEVIFWDEFGTNFNFIAVDYLVYTHEIIGTIVESLPVAQILITMFFFALFLTLSAAKKLMIKASNFRVGACLLYALTLWLAQSYAAKHYSSSKFALSDNKYAHELGKNGPYEFVAAYYNNSLDYNRLYTTIDSNVAIENVRRRLIKQNQQFLRSTGIERLVLPRHIYTSVPKLKYKPNVIVITVESLSSSFMGKFGNTENITPYLDKLADESLFFTNIYASGTRTVRGLEAITLSVPPTPGSSIIRRPDNAHLFNIGSVFRGKNYDVNFIFGGYSYFDNLQNYFENNDYRNIDRASLSADEISFSNVWGVADEDILKKSLEVADQSFRKGKSFFSLIMTTSNHRPYTFPEGRIDLPSGAGRSAAVKYTDYAIGKFIEEAKKRPWFNRTIFVITADHCAVGTGKTDLPVNKYHIPLMVYAPSIIKPEVVTNLASQIDIAPTIFGLLNFEYKSKFFGSDILNYPANRAFIGTYQLLGYMKDKKLIVLAPNSSPKAYELVGENSEDKVPIDEITERGVPALIEEAISFYQAAYDLYAQGEMKDF